MSEQTITNYFIPYIRPPPGKEIVYSILYYYYTITMGVAEVFLLQKLDRNNSETLLFFTLQYMKSFDLISNPNRFDDIIDLAGIVDKPSEKRNSRTIKIDVQESESEQFAIPLKVREEICIQQLQDLIKNKIATKVEFRLWNNFKRSFERRTANFNF